MTYDSTWPVEGYWQSMVRQIVKRAKQVKLYIMPDEEKALNYF